MPYFREEFRFGTAIRTAFLPANDTMIRFCHNLWNLPCLSKPALVSMKTAAL
jgi:hypothetical protein